MMADTSDVLREAKTVWQMDIAKDNLWGNWKAALKVGQKAVVLGEWLAGVLDAMLAGWWVLLMAATMVGLKAFSLAKRKVD